MITEQDKGVTATSAAIVRVAVDIANTTNVSRSEAMKLLATACGWLQIVKAARGLVLSEYTDGMRDGDSRPWWGYIYDGMTLECVVCGASTPGLDDGKTTDAQTFAAMKHLEDCPAMRLDAAVRQATR